MSVQRTVPRRRAALRAIRGSAASACMAVAIALCVAAGLAFVTGAGVPPEPRALWSLGHAPQGGQ